MPSGELRLGAFSLISDDDIVGSTNQFTFTIEFDLRQALTFNPDPDRYILKPKGISLLNNAAASSLEGSIDSQLFDAEDECRDKEDPERGNVIYLFPGHDLAIESLTDVSSDATSPPLTDNSLVAPVAATTPVQAASGDWSYAFGFLPEGEYTLVFSCDAEDDDPDSREGISMPLPEEQVLELSLTAGTSTLCDLPIVANACSN